MARRKQEVVKAGGAGVEPVASGETDVRPSAEALRVFKVFLAEAAHERALASNTTPEWLSAVSVAKGTDTLAFVVHRLSAAEVLGAAARLALPMVGLLFGPVGGIVGMAAAAGWSALSTRKHLERLAEGADPVEVDRIAARLTEAERLFSELQDFREDDPQEVERQLRQLFVDVVEDRPLPGVG